MLIVFSVKTRQVYVRLIPNLVSNSTVSYCILFDKFNLLSEKFEYVFPVLSNIF